MTNEETKTRNYKKKNKIIEEEFSDENEDNKYNESNDQENLKEFHSTAISQPTSIVKTEA